MTLQEKEEAEVEIPLAPAMPFADPVPAPPNSSIAPGVATLVTNSIKTPEPIKQPPSQRTVDVIAPSDLPAGFEFYVDDPTTPYVSLLVRVPAGGARATQRFAAIVVREVNRGSHNIPHGKWRDGLCDCWNLGCCHPQWCLTFWCTPCALGQVLTRLKLNACASPRQAVDAGLTAFQILFAVQVVSVVVSIAVRGVVGYYNQDAYADDDIYNGDEAEAADVPGWVDGLSILNSVVAAIVFIFMLIATWLLRRYVRNKYQIPDKCCGGCEDFCCAFWCQMCTICQLARHTADYHRYQAGCCTEDGLATGTPSVV